MIKTLSGDCEQSNKLQMDKETATITAATIKRPSEAEQKCYDQRLNTFRYLEMVCVIM